MKQKKVKIIVASCGIILNLALAIIKTYLGLRTNSISILSDAYNNYLDVFSCVIAIVGIVLITLPSNEKYPQGFGRAEYIVNFVMSLVISVVGIIMLYNAAERLLYPRPIWMSTLYAFIIFTTFFVKVLMGIVYSLVAKRTNSQIVSVLAFDSYVDSALTLTVLISLLLMKFTVVAIDAIAGIIIGVVIVINGVKLVIFETTRLMGKNLDTLSKKLLSDYLENNDLIAGIENIISHDYGVNAKTVDITINVKNDSITQFISTQEEYQTCIKEKFGYNANFILKKGDENEQNIDDKR